MSNLLKSHFVTIDPDDKRIIDSDGRLAEKNDGRSVASPVSPDEEPESFQDDFNGGLAAAQVAGLLADQEENIIKAGSAGEEELRQELLRQAEEEMARAEAEIQAMKEAAQADIEVMKRVAAEEARGQGYAEGFEKGVAEIEKLRAKLQEDRRKLQMEYDSRVDELEPKFIDLLADIYEQIFHVELKEYGPIVSHLISNTMRKSEENKQFLIHVSKEEYEYVSGHKEEIRENAAAGKAVVEIINDITLLPGECMIETGGGVFDISLGTELAGLNQKLRLLSFEK